MGTVLVILGGAALLYFGSRPGSPLAAVIGGVVHGAEDAISGAVHGTVKLGNADPNFEPWLTQEMGKIFGAIGSQPPQRQADFDVLEKSIRNRRIGSLYSGVWTAGYWKSRPGDCGAPSSANSLQAIGLSAGLASQTANTVNVGLGLAGTAEQFANAVPVVGGIISTITNVLSSFFGAHTRAVAIEQQTLCQVIPQINAWLDQLDQQYRVGILSGTQAVQALETIYQQMNQGLARIEHVSGCNASCVYLRMLRGIIDAKSLFDY